MIRCVTRYLFAGILCLFCTAVFADLDDIINILNTIAGYQVSIKGNTSNIQQDIEKYMAGQNPYYVKDFDDTRWRWNDAASSFDFLMDFMKKEGQGSATPLGSVTQNLSQNFPLKSDLIHQMDKSKLGTTYYDLHAKTALAAQATSQVDYNQISEQIRYEENLKTKIGETENLKQAVDLNNRLQIENNLIMLGVLRQLALLNQQEALTSQSDINDVVANANFLSP